MTRNRLDHEDVSDIAHRLIDSYDIFAAHVWAKVPAPVKLVISPFIFIPCFIWILIVLLFIYSYALLDGCFGKDPNSIK